MRDILPSYDVERGTLGRKALVVGAVASGDLTADAACARYKISRDEFLMWERLENRYGVSGLHTTRAENYRK
jgi:hypothetical protein